MKPLRDTEYVALKKRMREDFRSIRRSVKKDKLPPSDTVASFLADSAKMVSYPGKGDEHYVEYTKIVAEFRKAWEAQDLSLLQTSVSELRDIKSACHERYK
jgi:XXXCH domain-containing protein